jgi:hypothetical protein
MLNFFTHFFKQKLIRWRKLGGVDLDKTELLTKVQGLQK